MNLSKKTKRTQCRQRYKIEKRVKDHNRKLRKVAKKTKTTKQGKTMKNLRVPNSFPFKEQILEEAKKEKEKKEELKQKLKVKRKIEKSQKPKPTLQAIQADALKKQAAFAMKNDVAEEEDQVESSVENSRKAYYKEFKKVVEAADVVIEVLDARDPLGTRCPQVEQAVLSSGGSKRLVLLLNKIDLVPKENIEKWVKSLRNEFPALAFKASTQNQKQNLGMSRVAPLNATKELLQTSKCIGGETLLNLLRNYCRKKDIRSTITVGIVGFPNVGKSSVINSLKRSQACNIGGIPGVTKTMQEIKLDKHIKLLDSPGIVMATGDSDTATILKNCVNIDTLDDPIPAVDAIMRRCTQQQLMIHYCLRAFSSTDEFLSLLAMKMGRLKKGGVPDVKCSAKRVLRDWTIGNIKYYTEPPEQRAILSTTLVAQFNEEFDLNSLEDNEKMDLGGLKEASFASAIVLQDEGQTDGMRLEADQDDSAMEEDDRQQQQDKREVDKETVFRLAESESKRGEKRQAPSEKKLRAVALTGNEQLNKARKVAFKKNKRDKKKTQRLSQLLADQLASKVNEASYDFKTDYDAGVGAAAAAGDEEQ